MASLGSPRLYFVSETCHVIKQLFSFLYLFFILCYSVITHRDSLSPTLRNWSKQNDKYDLESCLKTRHLTEASADQLGLELGPRVKDLLFEGRAEIEERQHPWSWEPHFL